MDDTPEVPEGVDIYSQEYRDSQDAEAKHAEMVHEAAEDLAEAIAADSEVEEDVIVTVEEKPPA